MNECNRCGKCCFFPTGLVAEDGKRMVMKACRFLIWISPGKYHCRIYQNRLGTVIGKDVHGNVYKCIMYNDIDSEIKGCPLNQGGKPLHNVAIFGKIALEEELDVREEEGKKAKEQADKEALPGKNQEENNSMALP